MKVYCYLLFLFLSSYAALAAADEYKYNWTKYHDLFDTYNYMEKLKEDHPQSVTILEIGKTYGKAPIRVLKITKEIDYPRGHVFIAAGWSACAWLSISTATYIMNELLNSKDKHIQYISERYDWYIAPVLNPDGYDYTWTTNRLWYNNRQPYGKCFGADLNKNFNLNWQYFERNSNSCIGQFNGFYPHSEVETRSWVDFMRTFSSYEIFAYFELLNFGQTIRFLTDVGYSASTREQWRLIAVNAAKVAAHRYGTIYRNFAVDHQGLSVSWVAKNFDIELPIAIEHRGSGPDQPPEQILPNAQEIFDSVVSMILQREPPTTDFDKDNN